MALERINVVNIYFEEDPNKPGFLQALPCFELQNGEVKRPFVNGKGNFMWVTDNEHIKIKSQKIIIPQMKTQHINLNAKK